MDDMPPTSDATRLRQRAVTLRTLARRIGSLHVLDLYRMAGAETWVGPSPQHCADVLRARRSALLAAADDLVGTAARLERQAAALEAATLPDPARVR